MISTKKLCSPQELVRTISLEKPGSPQDLVHFGIKGMHWGVRKERETSNGKSAQPKQLSARKEKHIKEHEARAATAQKEINRIQANPSKWTYIQNQRNEQVVELTKYRDQRLSDAKAIREGHLTSGQKKVILGASVAAGILATYGVYKFVDSGSARQMLNKRVPFSRNAMLRRKMSPDEIMNEVVKPINPEYGALGTKMNCRRCTMAYEMRRRGLDVKATNSRAGTGQTIGGMINALDPESNVGTGKIGVIKSLVNEARRGEKDGPVTTALKAGGGMGKELVGDQDFHRLTPAAKSVSIFNAIGKHGEGARGELGVKWGGMGGAHSMAWEVIGGKATIFDTQSGESYSLEKFTEDLAPNVSVAGITRLDNVNLNTRFLRKWIINA